MNEGTGKDDTNWLLIFVLWGLGIAAAMQFAKFSVSVKQLAMHYGIVEADVAILLSSMSIVAVLFGAIAGEIVGAMGTRLSLQIAGALGIGVSAAQAFLPAIEIMLITRLLEGIAHLLIVVGAPTAIIGASSLRHQSLAMGLWATFFGVAYALAGLGGIPILDAFGLAGLYTAHGTVLCVFLLLYMVLDTPAPRASDAPQWRRLAYAWRGQFTVYVSPEKSAPALVFFWHTLMFMALLTYLPAFAQDAAHEIRLATTLPLVSTAGSLAGGWMAQKSAAPFALAAALFLVLAGLAMAVYGTLGNIYFAYTSYAMMFVFGMIQATSFAFVALLNTNTADRAQANGAITQMGNLGTAIGLPVFAYCLMNLRALSIPVFVIAVCVAAILTVFLLARGRAVFHRPQ